LSSPFHNFGRSLSVISENRGKRNEI
jgi:hypothetical protein